MDDSTEQDVQAQSSLIPAKKRKRRNVLTRMRGEYKEGALAVLWRCVEERLKIKVWTRNYRYVRGICVGYLVAFDKHWNLDRDLPGKDVSHLASNSITQSVSSSETESGMGQKASLTLQDHSHTVVSHQSTEVCFSKQVTSSLMDSKDDVRHRKSDSRIPSKESKSKLSQQGCQMSNFDRSDSDLRRRPQTSSEHSGRTSPAITRSGNSRHGKSALPGSGSRRSEEQDSRKDCSSYKKSSTSIEHSRRTSPSGTRSATTKHGKTTSSGPLTGRLQEPESRKYYFDRTGVGSSRRTSLASSRTRTLESPSRHGRSLSPGSVRGKPREPATRKDYSSRHSSSAREQGSGKGSDRKTSLERFRTRTESDRESKPHASGRGLSPSEDKKDCVSGHDKERRKSYEMSTRTTSQQRMSETSSKVAGERFQDMARSSGELTEDIGRLSVATSGSCKAETAEYAGQRTSEYQDVLTRHVNQLFIRGDNVALVAIAN